MTATASRTTSARRLSHFRQAAQTSAPFYPPPSPTRVAYWSRQIDEWLRQQDSAQDHGRSRCRSRSRSRSRSRTRSCERDYSPSLGESATPCLLSSPLQTYPLLPAPLQPAPVQMARGKFELRFAPPSPPMQTDSSRGEDPHANGLIKSDAPPLEPPASRGIPCYTWKVGPWSWPDEEWQDGSEGWAFAARQLQANGATPPPTTASATVCTTPLRTCGGSGSDEDEQEITMV